MAGARCRCDGARPALRATLAAAIVLVAGIARAAEHGTPASTGPGTFVQLNALQREADALKSTLAQYVFYRERYAQAHGALRDLIGQVLAALESELGAYARAERDFPLGAPRLRSTPAALPDATSYRAVDAAAAVAQLARERRVVIVNEAHHAAQTRLLTLALLPRLRALGFTHFAAEALDERDRDLASRGYPVDASGTYVREPLYGEIVRTALKLGYVVVPYESTRPQDSDDAREEEQARHLLERVFRATPDARLFVHAGYAHAHEHSGYLDSEPMALRLKRMTGLDPLTVDQTLLRPGDAQREYRDYETLRARFAARTPVLLLAQDGNPWSLEPAFYDASVLLPAAQQSIVGRPDWLRLDGARAPVAIDLDVLDRHLPCVVEARYAGESDKAIPADRVLVEQRVAQAVLFLRPGNYLISASDANSHVLFSRRLKVDAGDAVKPAS